MIQGDQPKAYLSGPVFLPGGANVFSWRCTTSNIMWVFSLTVLILSFSWVILMVLKVDMAMAAIEMQMAMKHFCQLGVEISDFSGGALIMSQKSSSKLSIVTRLLSVTDLVMDLKGSLCSSRILL